MKIKHLTLKTHALAALREFYADHMGLNVIEEADDAFTLDAGESRLTFAAGDEDDVCTYYFAFSIPYSQMMDAELWLTQRVMLIVPPGAADAWVEHADWGAEAFYCHDPAGSVVGFIGWQQEAESTAIPFSAQSIQCISQVGLSAADPDREIAALRASGLALPDFGAGSPDLRAVGGATGLLIIARTGRPWFPAQTAAAVHPVELAVAGAAPARFTVGRYPYQIIVAE